MFILLTQILIIFMVILVNYRVQDSDSNSNESYLLDSISDMANPNFQNKIYIRIWPSPKIRTQYHFKLFEFHSTVCRKLNKM